LSEILNGVASIEKFTLLSIDVSDCGSAVGSTIESRVESHYAGFGQKGSDVDEFVLESALKDRQINSFVLESQFSVFLDFRLLRGNKIKVLRWFPNHFFFMF
jgi:hypothetical protein